MLSTGIRVDPLIGKVHGMEPRALPIHRRSPHDGPVVNPHGHPARSNALPRTMSAYPVVYCHHVEELCARQPSSSVHY
jgi:hypothetical protein